VVCLGALYCTAHEKALPKTVKAERPTRSRWLITSMRVKKEAATCEGRCEGR
jgi:hypothetical protein